MTIEDTGKDNPSSPFPEGELKPQKFTMRVENPDLFLKAIKRGVSGLAGSVLMEYPVGNVNAKLFGKKDHFNLEATIAVQGESVLGDGPETFLRPLLVFDGWKDLIKTHYGEAKERGGALIVKGRNDTTLVIYREYGHDGMCVSTGQFKQYSFQDPTQFGPAPVATEEGLQSAVEDVSEAVDLILGGMYEAGHKQTPQEELILRTPKLKLNGEKIGSESEIYSTPEELLGKLEIEKPDISFDDIGGQIDAKREIQGLAFALKNPELYKKWGTKPPKGILLHGPPGTGKTLMAKALASQADARFFHVETSDIAQKYYGESEKIVAQIFQLASQSGEDTIIFFDEIDAIAPHREGAHEATHRTVSTILENMDGLSSQENVIVVASTNNLKSIDPALLRAGRFDRWVEVPLPDEEGRKQIFDIHTRKAEQLAGRELFSSINLDAIIAKTDKLSGADIPEIIRRVLEEKVRQEGTGLNPSLVTTDDILQQIKGYEKVINTRRTIGFVTQQE